MKPHATAPEFVRLGGIVSVVRGTVDPPQQMFRVKGKPATGITVSMVSGGDIPELGRNIKTRDDQVRTRPAALHRHDACRRSAGSRHQRDPFWTPLSSYPVEPAIWPAEQRDMAEPVADRPKQEIYTRLTEASVRRTRTDAVGSCRKNETQCLVAGFTANPFHGIAKV